MKYIFLLFMLFVSPPCFAVDEVKNEKMPQSFTDWENQNAERAAKEENIYGELWSKTLLLLIVILAFLFVATWFMKRFDTFKTKPQDKGSKILLIERKVLSPKSVLYLIEIEGSRIALSESATNGVQVLRALSEVQSGQKSPE